MPTKGPERNSVTRVYRAQAFPPVMEAVNLRNRSCITYEDAPLYSGSCCCSRWRAPAQIPGQYPGQYPPGQYPPGQYPPGTQEPDSAHSRPDWPDRRPRTGQPQPESRGKRSNSEAQLLTTTSGILRRVAPNQLVIQPDDHRIVWYRLAPQLKVQKDGKDADLKDFALGDYLTRRFQFGRRQHQYRCLGDLEEGRDA